MRRIPFSLVSVVIALFFYFIVVGPYASRLKAHLRGEKPLASEMAAEVNSNGFSQLSWYPANFPFVTSQSGEPSPDAATFYNLNGMIFVDGVKYRSLSSAIAACSSAPCIVNDWGCRGREISTPVVFPQFPTQLYLGACTYDGPATGPAFVIVNTAGGGGPSGSAIYGMGATSGQENGGRPVTVIKAKASNPSDLIDLNFSGNVLNGLILKDFMLNGNNIASAGVRLDTVESSQFENLDIESVAGPAINAVVSYSGRDIGVQFNRFEHLRFSNVDQCLYATSNTTKASDFTQNYSFDWACNFKGFHPGIELAGADSNWFYALRAARSAGSAYDLQFDGPTRSSLGGIFNEIYGFHGNPIKAVNVQSGANFNQIIGYSTAENQGPPTVAAGTPFGYQASGLWANGSNAAAVGAYGFVPAVFATERMGLIASVGSTTIWTTPTIDTMLYVLYYSVTCSQAAAFSGSVTATVSWTDITNHAAAITTRSPNNTVGSSVSGSVVIRAHPNSTISYLTSYKSFGAMPFGYTITLRLQHI